jgi:(R)-amidase
MAASSRPRSLPLAVPRAPLAVVSLALACACAGCTLIENIGDYDYLSAPNGWSGATLFDDSDADVRFDVVATSLTVSPDPEDNRAHMVDVIDQIVVERPSTEIVLFGETIGAWYRKSADDDVNTAYQKSVAETVPGPLTDAMAQAARRHAIYVAFGMAERDGDKLYNSLVLMNPAGEVQAVHRKYLTVHSDVVTSLEYPYSNGEGATVTEVEGIPFGLIICNDMHSRTVAKGLAEGGVKVVLSALADQALAVDEGGFSPLGPLYDAWVVQANRHGEEADLVYPGAASIIDPAGSVRASMNGEGWVAVDLGVYR